MKHGRTCRTDKEHRCSLLDSGKGNQYCIDQAEHLSSIYARRKEIKDKMSDKK